MEIFTDSKLTDQSAAPEAEALAAQDGAASAGGDVVPVRELEEGAKVPYEVLRMIPVESAEHYSMVPLAVKSGVLEVGVTDPENITGIDALNFITRKTGMPFKLFRISVKDFHAVLAMYEGLTGEVEQALIGLDSERRSNEALETTKGAVNDPSDAPLDLNGIAAESASSVSDGKGGTTGSEIREDAPAIKLVSTILRYAIDGKASDVHIEPTSSGVRVRYRVDGTLHTSVVLPITVHRSLVARIKVLSSIRLDEQRKPQDGRFSAEIDGRKIDFRVSTFPSYYGEKIVIRILDGEQGFIPLADLGIPADLLAVVREALAQPHGLILISGPTGSGKSTTLYSMLSELNHDEKNVLSLEDPIEYNMEGVTQSQMRPEIGYTFANGLRTTLRQDPDIIMVGEIRDGETAKLAIQAALTGHLVLSTIHTNSAVGTIPRLVDMGVEPYLIPPTLILSIAQRLVRQLCPDGGAEEPMTESIRNMLDEQFADLPERKRPPIPNVIYQASRTSACPNGTRGRRAVFEVLAMTSAIEKVVLESPIESKIIEVARREGMMTMKEDAIIKSFARTVPFSEVNLLGSTLVMDEMTEEQPDAPAAEEAVSQEAAKAAIVPAPKTLDLETDQIEDSGSGAIGA
jgi:type IV pilus assembly protein PilB